MKFVLREFNNNITSPSTGAEFSKTFRNRKSCKPKNQNFRKTVNFHNFW